MLCLGIYLKVIAECCGEGHIATTEAQNAVGEFEFLEKPLYVCEHFFVALVGVLRCVNTHDLYLAELVQAVESAHVFAIRACLATEALGISAVLDRQLCLFKDDIAVNVGNRYLSSRDEVEVAIPFSRGSSPSRD